MYRHWTGGEDCVSLKDMPLGSGYVCQSDIEPMVFDAAFPKSLKMLRNLEECPFEPEVKMQDRTV